MICIYLKRLSIKVQQWQVSLLQNSQICHENIRNIYAYICIYAYIYIYEQETSVCKCCTVTIKQKIQSLYDEFRVLLILSHVCEC